MVKNLSSSVLDDPFSGGADRRKRGDFDSFFNAQFQEEPVVIKPYQFHCCGGDSEMIVGTVGAGIFVSLFHPVKKLGAAAYLLFPDQMVEQFPFEDESLKHSMDHMGKPVDEAVRGLQKMGIEENTLQVRLAGGAELPAYQSIDPEAGLKNYIFAREYITRLGLKVVNEDIGGSKPRRVHFFPKTGRMVRIILSRQDDYERIQKQEEDYKAQILG